MGLAAPVQVVDAFIDALVEVRLQEEAVGQAAVRRAFGEVPAIATLTAKIEAVTPAQVRDLAERLFRHQKPAFSAVGHIGQMAGYDAITRHFA